MINFAQAQYLFLLLLIPFFFLVHYGRRLITNQLNTSSRSSASKAMAELNKKLSELEGM